MNKQGKAWAGEFGNQYTKRNIIDFRNHLPIWVKVMKKFNPTHHNFSILEVGCNRGHNLMALASLGLENLRGIDLNSFALRRARKFHRVQYGDALAIPFRDSTFDLVFTMGVLIHIVPEDLPTAIQEMHRVSRGFVLSVEYPADEEETVDYHGNEDMLWKRDFHSEFVKTCPDLHLIKHWAWGTEANPFYDKVDGWLFKKEK